MCINNKQIRRLCIMGEPEIGPDKIPVALTTTLAHAMIETNTHMVCSGNADGLIYDVAKTVKASGGQITCVTADFFCSNRLLLSIADEILLADSPHQFKMLLFHASDSLVFLPRSIGTLDVLMEYLTWMQRVYHPKPVYIIDAGNTARLMLEMFQHMRTEHFLPANFETRYTLLGSLPDLIPALKITQ